MIIRLPTPGRQSQHYLTALVTSKVDFHTGNTPKVLGIRAVAGRHPREVEPELQPSPTPRPSVQPLLFVPAAEGSFHPENRAGVLFLAKWEHPRQEAGRGSLRQRAAWAATLGSCRVLRRGGVIYPPIPCLSLAAPGNGSTHTKRQHLKHF